MNNKQKSKLQELLIFLYDNNPYYSKIMKHMGCNPRIDSAVTIYQDMPFMDKKTLLEVNEEILTPSLKTKEYKFDFTSGTSGAVLKCYKTENERNALALNIWMQRKKIDLQVRPKNYISIFNRDFENVFGKFYNTNRDNVINLFEKIAELKPRWISGPVSVFEKMAYLILDGYSYIIDTLCVIEFMGEFVSVEQRNLIEGTFKCQTVNNYGAQEVWCMAFECKNHRMHIQDRFCILDYYQKNQRSDKNELIVTSLNNMLMPIIKYRLGDIGTITKDDCECGNSSECIVLQGGRVGDVIYGTDILGNYFFDQLVWGVNHIFNNAIYAFCVKQIDPLVFQFIVVRGRTFCDEVRRTIEERMKKEIGENIEIRWEFVENVSFGNNGKLKKFITYVK
ncbi:MAG: hypothetical protein HFH80_00200 [Lachnospiraceae bacterium]|nr:hypothetical protein [Lachnospiraceae bacterium]